MLCYECTCGAIFPTEAGHRQAAIDGNGGEVLCPECCREGDADDFFEVDAYDNGEGYVYD